jgi:transporter family-2 protein
MTLVGLVLIGLAILVGALVPVQAGINATLAAHGGHPLFAMAANMSLATLTVFAGIAALRVPLPIGPTLASAPWYGWLGGFCGAALVFSAITLAPRLGAAAFVSATIVGTVGASLIIDHFGLLAFKAQPISGFRLAGGALVVAGMMLVNKT